MTTTHEGMIGGSGLLVMMLAALSAACGGGEGAAAGERDGPAPLVLQPTDVAEARRADLVSTVRLTGTLNPWRMVEVRAQVPGTLTSLRVDRGDHVRRGQVMGVIEAEGIRGGAAAARAQVAAAEANLALARRQLESARRLHGAGALSDIELQTAEAAFEAARGQLAAAEAQALGAAESAQRATLIAPVGGEVSSRMVTEGEAVNPGQPLLTIVNAERLELYGQIPVSEASRVRPGQPVEFTVTGYGPETFAGEVARVEPTADPDTRQVGVYLRLPNEGRRIVGGLYATGKVRTGVREDVVVVPGGAVRGEGEEPYVWVIRDGRLARQPVVLGVRDPEAGVVEVVSGLEGGERLLAVPGDVQEGAPVRMAEEGRPPASPEEVG